jgi:hypothetical protein
VIGIGLAGYGLWGSLALYYKAPMTEEVRICLSVIFLLFIGFALIGLLKRRWNYLLPALLLCFSVFIWWNGIAPSAHRNWAEEVSRSPVVRIVGSRITVENIRNFVWTSSSKARPAWNNREYDLNSLETVDLFASYWNGKAIAHTFVSFGFADRSQLAFSAELRRSKGQSYETLRSLFKLSELIVIAADERDVVGVRAKQRGEDVHLYRLRLSKESVRKLFLAYARDVNELSKNPLWYNTLTNNCTTTIFDIARMLNTNAHYDWRVLLPGYFPQYAYAYGALDKSLSFNSLEARSHISELAKRADTSSSISFSRDIRSNIIKK